MAVVKMQKISICALKKNRKAILEKLQSLGVLEIGRVLDEDADFRRMERNRDLRKQPHLSISLLRSWTVIFLRNILCLRLWKERN